MSLEANKLSFRYPRRGRGPVLEGVSLTLAPGERLGLSGPSGRGKTTLCKLLAGYERPGRGEILLDGLPLSRYRGACPVQMIWQHPEAALDPLLPLGKSLEEEVTEADMAAILASPQGGRKCVGAGMAFRCLLNKADTPALERRGEVVAGLLAQKGIQAYLNHYTQEERGGTCWF